MVESSPGLSLKKLPSVSFKLDKYKQLGIQEIRSIFPLPVGAPVAVSEMASNGIYIIIYIEGVHPHTNMQSYAYS